MIPVDRGLPCFVALHRALHLDVVAVIGREEVCADEQEDDVRTFKPRINGAREFLTGADPAVMPCLDDALTLQERELLFELIP